MAGADRTAADHMNPLSAVAAEPDRFGLFRTLRTIEAAHPERPRIGVPGARAIDEPVRLAQAASLAFPPAEIAGVAAGWGGRPHLRINSFGLFGPQGPMPLHLTEFILDRRQFHSDDAFARFADIFHHRLIALFYRAWAEAEPTVSHDRPAEDRFGHRLACLIGYGAPSARDPGDRIDRTRLYFAGRLVATPRNPEGLEAIVAGAFGVPARVVEFVAGWLRLDRSDRWRLGGQRVRGSRPTRLGEGTVAGARVRDAQHRFRLVIGPMSIADYVAFLPGGRPLPDLRRLVDGYADPGLEWDVRLVLRREDVLPMRLGAGIRLGWTTWLGGAAATADRGDLVLRRAAAATPSP
jgi:type VI secretion system protein ImpH